MGKERNHCTRCERPVGAAVTRAVWSCVCGSMGGSMGQSGEPHLSARLIFHGGPEQFGGGIAFSTELGQLELMANPLP